MSPLPPVAPAYYSSDASEEQESPLFDLLPLGYLGALRGVT